MLGLYIYIAGCILSFIFTYIVAYIELDNTYNVNKDILVILLVSLLSWFSFIVIGLSYIADKLNLVVKDYDDEEFDDYYY